MNVYTWHINNIYMQTVNEGEMLEAIHPSQHLAWVRCCDIQECTYLQIEYRKELDHLKFLPNKMCVWKAFL